MNVSPECKSHFPDVIFLQMPLLHLGREHVCNWIQRRGAACTEILRELACAGTGARENVIENTGLRQGVVDITFHRGDETRFD